MANDSRIPYEAEMHKLVIGPELPSYLHHLIQTMRRALKPRHFAELYFVDEMAISYWRKMRTKIMEKSIYDYHRISYRPRCLKDRQGHTLEPLEDMRHMAQANAPELEQAVLTALGRLEDRFHRQICSSYRLLLASRRYPPPTDDEMMPGILHDYDETQDTDTTEDIETTELTKEPNPCSPSPNSSNECASPSPTTTTATASPTSSPNAKATSAPVACSKTSSPPWS